MKHRGQDLLRRHVIAWLLLSAPFRGVDHAPGLACDLSDLGDPVSLKGDIAVEPWIARAVDDFAMADDDVVWRRGAVKKRGAEEQPGDHTTPQQDRTTMFHGIAVSACAGTRNWASFEAG